MKKAIRFVLCFCLVFCFLPAVSAASVPAVKLTCDNTVDEDRMLYIDIRFRNAVGLTGWDIRYAYDSSVLKFEYLDLGDDAVQMAYLRNNNFSYDENPEKNAVSGYFLQSLWSKTEMDANVKTGKTVTIDPNDFHAYILAFSVKSNVDIERLHTEISVSGEFAFSSGRRTVYDAVALADLQPAHVHTPGEDADCGHDQVCLTCGAILAYATGLHTYGDWTVTREPDCTAEGLEQCSCITCGHTETRPVSPLGHEYGNWTAIRYATQTETGLRYCTCIRCENPQIETLEKLQAMPGDVNADGNLNSADARLALRISVHLGKSEPWQTAVADTDGDFAVTAADARLILRKAVQLEKAFPVEG